jgi:hypothetical protein
MVAQAPRMRAKPHDPTTAAFNVPGSLAEGLKATNSSRTEEQAAEAVSHCVVELRGLPLGVVAGQRWPARDLVFPSDVIYLL